MHLKTVDDLRQMYATKTPLFHVEYLPYLGPYLYPAGDSGHEDDIYTTLVEAKRRFKQLSTSGTVEEVELYKTVYDRRGGRARRLLDEWHDRHGRGGHK